MPTENEMRQLRLIQRIRAPLLTPDAETRQAVIDAVWREAGDSDEEILMAFMSLQQALSPQQREQVLRIPWLRRIIKCDLWKAVTNGNVYRLGEYHQGVPADLCVNSRTGWTIVHEAVERGHSGTMLTMVVQIMGPDSVNKKTRTGLTPAHVAASKRDTVSLMALANLGADLSVLAADRVQLRELQKQASEAQEK